MGYKIHGSELEEMLKEQALIGIETDTSGYLATQTVKFRGGNLTFKEELLRNDLIIVQGDYTTADNDLLFNFQENNPLLELHFNLSSAPIDFKNNFKSPEQVAPMSGNMIYMSPDNGRSEITLAKDQHYSTFDIHLPLDLLKPFAGEDAALDSFLESILLDRSAGLSHHSIGISARLYNTIENIRSCEYGGITRKLYLESKVYEVIALCCEQLNQPDEPKLSKYDQECIYQAAELIKTNIDRPCTILDLARKVGINQTKLKQGFKIIFNNTVFGYLQDLRMGKAQQYLLDTELPIEEICCLSGYKNLSNFSSAFKKIYGYAPSRLRKAHLAVH